MRVLKFVDDLVDFLNRIGSALARLQLYEKLIPDSPRLNRILFQVFIRYLELCSYLRDSFVKDGTPRLTRIVTWKFTTESFKNVMAEKIAHIDSLCKEAHSEAQLAVVDVQLKAAEGLHEAFENLSIKGKNLYEEGVKGQKQVQLKEAKRRFLEWLRQVPTEEDFDKFKKSQLESTCQWIEDDPRISSWLYSTSHSSSLLWISGSPGCGKTILSAHIIDQLQPRYPTAYFFCKIDDERKRTAIAILQNWIWQLVHNSLVLPEEVTQPSDQHRSPTVSILREVLEKLQQYLKPSWLIVDGLDECEEGIAEFLQCCQSLSTGWRILIVSRDVPSIRAHLEDSKAEHKAMTTRDNATDIKDYVIHKMIRIQDTKEDLDNFVAVRADELAKRKGWDAVQESISKMLSSNAEGMFLWVKLVFDFLLEESTLLDDVDDVLQSIPAGLDEFYDRVMTKISSHPSRKRIAQKSLDWIIYAFRPLTLDELQAALSFGENSSKTIHNFEAVLRESCGLLIKIDERTKEVSVIHATVQEYLLRRGEGNPLLSDSAENVHSQLTRVCLMYLCAKGRTNLFVDSDIKKSRKTFQDHLGSRAYSLLDYSTVYWCQHAERSKSCIRDWEQPLRQFANSEDLLITWLQLFRYLYASGHLGTLEAGIIIRRMLWPENLIENTELKAIIWQQSFSPFLKNLGLAEGKRFLRWDCFICNLKDTPAFVPAVLVAAHFNFSGFVKKEIGRRKWPIDKTVFDTGTALLWASRTDSIDTMRYLLTQGSAVNDRSHIDGETALFKAIATEELLADSTSGSYPAVSLLLDAGADIDLIDRRKWNALHVLINSKIRDGECEVLVAKELLKRNPRLYRADHPEVGSLLHHAISRNLPHIATGIRDEVLAQNPEHPPETLERRFRGDTVLHVALRQQPHLVPILLDQGANMYARDSQSLLPIEIAIQNNLGPVIKELVNRGISVASTGSHGKPLLELALEVQSMEAVKALLDMGADVNEIPEHLLLLPRAVDLDPRVKASKPQDFPWPLSPRDVYQICFHFRQFHSLSIPLIAKILDMAELWIKSSVIRNDQQIVNTERREFPYLTSPEIVGREDSPVQKIDIAIKSHDQGFDDSGGASGNWTWFEIRPLRKSGKKQLMSMLPQPGSVFNRLANWQWHTHKVTWSLPQPSFRKWTTLKPGDRIEIVPRAMFPGWTNFVGGMHINIYTSLLRRYYSQDEISEIWGMETAWDNVYTDYVRRAPYANNRPLRRLRHQIRAGLRILAGEYGGTEVSEILARKIDRVDQSLTLDTDVLAFLPDTWYGVVKSLSAIFQYENNDIQLLNTAQYMGTVKLGPNAPRMPVSLPQRSRGSDLSIIAIVYGSTEIFDEYVYKGILVAIAQRQPYLVTNDNMGGDPWPNTEKSCAVYYRREKNGPVFCSCCREGTSLDFSSDGVNDEALTL
jgi:ankyrin repeat protein